MKTYKDIAIKTNNQAEKLAALYFLADKTGLKIYDDVLSITLVNKKAYEDFPFVYVCREDGNDYVSAASRVEDEIVVQFSELSKIDDILKNENKPKIEVGKKYFYKNGDFVVPISIYGSNKYVLGGSTGNPFSLYSNGHQYTEREMLQELSNYKLE